MKVIFITIVLMLFGMTTVQAKQFNCSNKNTYYKNGLCQFVKKDVKRKAPMVKIHVKCHTTLVKNGRHCHANTRLHLKSVFGEKTIHVKCKHPINSQGKFVSKASNCNTKGV